MKINLDSTDFQSALAALGLTPFAPRDFPNEGLFSWMIRPRFPIWASEDPLLRQMIGAVLRRERTSFFYFEGSTPGRVRTISPDLVFQLDEVGHVYVSGYCHERKETRVFRFDRMLATTILN